MTDAPSWAQDQPPAWAGGSSTPQPAPQAPPPAPPQGFLDKIVQGTKDATGLDFSHLPQGLGGAYKQAVSNNLMIQPLRAGMEWAANNVPAAGDFTGMDRIKKLWPGQTDAWYAQKYHAIAGQAVTNMRQEATQQVKANPYPGHIVPNTIAAIAGSADPTWLINPGGSVELQAVKSPVARAAIRVGVNAGAHAYLGGASDYAAQAMDVAEGQKKDFDVNENLQAAGMSSLFGAGFQGAHEVAPFVKDLFKARGLDTTPPVDPRGETDPMTGQSVRMTPDEQMQFKQIVRNGSVDDIKNFLATKQGPKPTWSQVNELVKMRDGEGMPSQFLGQDNLNDAIDQHLSGVQQQLVSEHIQAQTAGWKNAPDIEVVRGPQDIQDPAVRQQIMHENPGGGALGVYGSDGKVRIFSDQIHSPELANAVLYHEALGHYGLQQQFGSGLDKTLQTLLDRNVGSLARDTDAYLKANPDLYNGSRVRAAEEVLAQRSQNGQLKPVLMDAIVARIKQFGRRMGLNLAYSDNEVQHILSMAHDAVVNGKGRDVIANGFRGTKEPGSAPNSQWLNMSGPEEAGDSKFMFTGPKAKGFSPWSPTTRFTQDGIPRNEISDHNSQFIRPDEEGLHYLGDILDHPELYKNYPELRDTRVHFGVPDDPRIQGQYSPDRNYININSQGSDVHSATLHEVQHAIQNIEDVPGIRGGTSGLSDEDYRNNALEKEARATQARMDMGPIQRAVTPLGKNKFMTREESESSRNRAFSRLASEQRGAPEQAMLAAQRAVSNYPSGNTYGTLLEHVGDLTHRMSEPYAQMSSDFGQEFVSPKVDMAIRALSNPVDNDRLNASQPWQESAVKDYVNAHSNLKTYNTPQWLGKSAAIKLGEGDLQGSLRDLKALQDIIKSGGYPKLASEYGPVNRFMNRRDLASSSDYVADDLEGIYKSLDENYVPSPKPWAEQQRDALNLGFSPSDIKKLRGADDLSTYLWRLQSAANMADAKISALNEKLGTADWSVADSHAYLETLAQRDYLVQRIKGDRSEIGRALQVAKAASSYSNATMEQIAQKLHEANSGLAVLAEDPTKFMRFANEIKDLMAKGNPEAARVKMAGVNKPYWEQYLNTFHFNAMLSGLSTHVKAPLDMMTGIARDTIERGLAIPVGHVWRTVAAITGETNPKPAIHPEEVAADMYGLIRGTFNTEVYKQAGKAALTGQGSYVAPDRSVTPTNFNNDHSVSNPQIPGVSIPSNLISAQDTVFRSVSMQKQLYALGTRQARAELGPKASTGDVLAMGSNLAHNPTEGMLKQARDITDRTLLLNSNPINKILDKWRGYRPGMGPWERVAAFVTTNLAPFIRVESNSLLNRVIQRSPLGFLDPYTIKQLKMGGPEAHIALTKILYGTTLFGMYWAAADKGANWVKNLTGNADKQVTGDGPDSPDKYKEMEAGGFTPRSVHENGRFNQANSLAMSVNPFDLHNSTATMAADMREAYEKGANKGQVGQGVKLALGAMFHDMATQSWINDFQPAIDAATAHGQEGQSKGAQFLGDEAKSWVPNILNQANRTITNPNQVDTRTETPGDISGQVVNDVKSAIPGLSNSLPTKYSVYGDPLPTGASFTGVHTWLSNGNGKPMTQDPAEQELERLGALMKGEHALVTPVSRSIKLTSDPNSSVSKSQIDENGTIKLTIPQFEQYQHLVGREIVEHVRQEMASPEWQSMSDEERAEEVKSIQTDMKKAVKEHLFGTQ